MPILSQKGVIFQAPVCLNVEEEADEFLEEDRKTPTAQSSPERKKRKKAVLNYEVRLIIDHFRFFFFFCEVSWRKNCNCWVTRKGNSNSNSDKNFILSIHLRIAT